MYLYCSYPEPPRARPFRSLSFTKLCYIPKTPKPSGSKEKRFFEYVYFFVSNKGPPWAEQFGSRDLHLNNFGKGQPGIAREAISDPRPICSPTWQCCLPNLRHQNQVVLKRMFEYFPLYFYDSNQKPRGYGHFAP